MGVRTSYSESSNSPPQEATIASENSSELEKTENLDVPPLSNKDSQKLDPYAACKALIKAGLLDEVLMAAEALDEDWKRDETFFKISEAFAKTGRFDKALQAAKPISNKYRKCEAFHNICKALAKAGRFDEALQVARDHIFLQDYLSLAIADICAAMAKAGQLDGALTIAATIPDEKYKWRTFSNISKALAKIGDAKRIITIAGMILNETEMSVTLERCTKILVKISLIDEAIEVAKAIPCGYCKRRALECIVKALKLAGDTDKAKEIKSLTYGLPYPTPGLGMILE